MQRPSEDAVTAWARLVRAERAARTGIESELKEAGFPPLAWYDVLLELGRKETGRLTPRELEEETLFEQYNCSRLIDRMENEGLVRRIPYPGDRRRQLVEMTDKGHALRQRMWPVYAAGIERYVGSKLEGDDSRRLSEILAKLLRP